MEHIPKNIRQIGGNEDRVKIYMEDYVSTYLRRVRELREEHGAAGFLVGSWQQDGVVPCAFVSGAMAVLQAGMEGGQVSFSPEAWNEAYQSLGTYFSGQELCGIFVCEGSCRRFRKQALFAAARECFPERQVVLYLLTEDGEEIVYRVLPRGEDRLQGYYCYFERNESMQDYMVDHLPDRRVERELPQAGWEKEGALGDPADPAYRFRQKMGKQKPSAGKKGETSGRSVVALCAVMALVIVISGMGLAYREKSGVQIRDLLSQLHISTELLSAVSAMPEETGEHYVGRENSQSQGNRNDMTGESHFGITVEEIPGNVYPTEDEDEGITAGSEITDPSETESLGIETSGADTSTADTTTAETPEADTTTAETPGAENTTEEAAESPETTPSVPETEESFPVGTGVLYTVKAGDSLYSISRRFYGTEEMAAVIQEMNDLENADLIKVGQELLLP